jgi:hypothetical protein
MLAFLAEPVTAAVSSATELAKSEDLRTLTYLVIAVLATQVLTAIALVRAHMRLAHNEAQLGDLLREAVDRLEGDLKK